MEYNTQQWLKYTDGLLAKQDKSAEEITLLMSIQRGPDYVRTAAREGAPISPKSDDRGPVKALTTAVLRALCFPQTAALLSKGGKLVDQLKRDFGVSQAKAEAVAALLNGEAGTKSSWQVDAKTVGAVDVPFATYSNRRTALNAVMTQVGTASHFGIKVRKAAALFGYTI